jgi:hypothetical protein
MNVISLQNRADPVGDRVCAPHGSVIAIMVPVVAPKKLPIYRENAWGPRFAPFGQRWAHLPRITGQQQYSGGEVARLVIEAVGT